MWASMHHSARLLLSAQTSSLQATHGSVLLQNKLLSQAERSLELLDVDESKYADEMVAQQEDFVGKVNSLATVSALWAAVDCSSS